MSYIPSTERIVVEKVAGETIDAHKIVKQGADGKLYHASCVNLDDMGTIVGMSLNAADAGEMVRVLVFGTYENPALDFDVGKPLFLGVNGRMVQDIPDEALFIQKLGRVTAPHEILIDLDESIVVE